MAKQSFLAGRPMPGKYPHKLNAIKVLQHYILWACAIVGSLTRELAAWRGLDYD